MSRVLITGGAGFIGSHLTDRLLADGQRVTILDDFSQGSERNISAAKGDLEVIRGSILNEVDLLRALRNVTEVYHLAVRCVRRSLAEPVDNHHINATGTLLTLEGARRSGVSRFIYCSSSEVYGNGGSGRLTEDGATLSPETVYAAAKLVGEQYSQVYGRIYGLDVMVVRPFNAYGPRAHETGDLAEVIPRFALRVMAGQAPVVFGSGSQGRDFTYVTELVDGIARLGGLPKLGGQTVNIAYGNLVRVTDLAEMIPRLLQRPDLRPIQGPNRPGDVMALHADTTRARALIGWAPTIDIETGLIKYLNDLSARFPDRDNLPAIESTNFTMPSEMVQ